MEKEVATHSSILARRIQWTEGPGGLLSVGSHRVGPDWSDLACMHACIEEGNGNSLQYSSLENPMDRRAWRAAVYGVAQSQTRLKGLSNSSILKVVSPKFWTLFTYAEHENCRRIWRSSLNYLLTYMRGCSGGASVKELACQYRRRRKCRFSPWVGKIPWRRAWQLTPVFFPGEIHGQRSLAGHNPWGHKELDILKQLRAHTTYIR